MYDPLVKSYQKEDNLIAPSHSTQFEEKDRSTKDTTLGLKKKSKSVAFDEEDL